MIKGFKRTFKDKHFGHMSQADITAPTYSKDNANALKPPKKIIKALFDYVPQNVHELGFKSGDFFHVIGNEDDQEWYEVANPCTRRHGMVPVSYFQIISNTSSTAPNSAKSAHSHASSPASSFPSHPSTSKSADMLNYPSGSDNSFQTGYGKTNTSTMSMPIMSSTSNNNNDNRVSNGDSTKLPELLGVMMYDFQSERADELSTKANEWLQIVAVANSEWLVAKPIGRLGGPGMVPITYVEVRDITTCKPLSPQQTKAMLASLPSVDEWAKLTAFYKASGVDLGSLEENNNNDKNKSKMRSSAKVAKSQSAHNFTSSNNKYAVNKNSLSSNTNSTSSSPPLTSDRINTTSTMNSNPSLSPSSSDSHVSQLSDFSRDLEQHSSVTSVSPSNSEIMPKSIHAIEYANKLSSLSVVPIANSCVESVSYDGDYWYSVVCETKDGRFRRLCRYYDDFYEMHIQLLKLPEGRGPNRIIPYMPGRILNKVPDSVAEDRRIQLNVYLMELLSLPAHISQSELVKRFFSPLDYDIESYMPILAVQHPSPKRNQQNMVKNISVDASEEFNIKSSDIAPPSAKPTQPSPSFASSAFLSSNFSNNKPEGQIKDSGEEFPELGVIKPLQVSRQQPNSRSMESSNGRFTSSTNNNNNTDNETNFESAQRALQNMDLNDLNSTLLGDDTLLPKNDMNNYQSYVGSNPYIESLAADGYNSTTSLTKTITGNSAPPSSNGSVLRSQTSTMSLHKYTNSQESLNNNNSNHNSQSQNLLQQQQYDAIAKEGFVKVKVRFSRLNSEGIEIVAVRVPKNVSFNALENRLCLKLDAPKLTLLYEDTQNAGIYRVMRNDNDFKMAVGKKDKIVIRAQAA